MKKTILTAVALLALAAPAAAAAQVQRAVLQHADAQLIQVADDRGRGHGRREWRREHRREWRDDRRHYRHGYRDGRRHERWNDRHVYVRPRYYAPPVRHYYAPPAHYGYRPGYAYHQPRWHRGGYLPHGYHGWYVRDYYNYGWAPPPPGYGYYRSDTGDIILAAVATGLILSVIAGAW